MVSPKHRVPKFFAFNKRQHFARIGINQHYFFMVSIHVGERRHKERVGAKNPFRMVKAITFGSRDRANQFTSAIGNQRPFMRTVRFSHELATSLAAKIKEYRPITAIIGKRDIACLLSIIPDRIFPRRHSYTQKSRSRNRKLLIRTYASMERPIKKLLRCSKFSFCKRDLPCTHSRKVSILFIICGT